MKVFLVWLALCTSVYADNIFLRNVSLITTYSDSGYPVSAIIWSPHGNMIQSGDQWTVGFSNEKVRKKFFDIINDNEKSDISRINVDVVGEESLSIYGKNITIKSLSKTNQYIK